MKKGGVTQTSGSGQKPGPGVAPILAAALWLALVGPATALAHGVEVSIKKESAVTATALYDGGEALSFAKVKVLSPTGKTHQVGNADAAGRFSFIPGGPGEWKITFNDGMGHQTEISWKQEAAKPKAPAGPQAAAPAPARVDPTPGIKGQPLWVRVVWGLAFLWGAGGLAFWLLGKKKR